MSNSTGARTIAQIKFANRAIGHHFFDADTLEFFNSQILAGVYSGPAGDFFVTSEQFDETEPRRYTVRHALADGSIDTFGEFTRYATAEAAKRAARKIADSLPGVLVAA